jgi:hypothetical protein
MNRPTLDYAHPDVFYENSYRDRTPQTMTGVIIGLGVFFTACGVLAFSRLSDHARIGIGLFASVFGLIGGWCAWAYFADQEHVTRVTTDGFSVDRWFWSWREVETFGAVRSDEGLWLYVTLRSKSFSRGAPPNDSMSEDDYENLRATLDRYFTISGLNVVTLDPIEEPRYGS